MVARPHPDAHATWLLAALDPSRWRYGLSSLIDLEIGMPPNGAGEALRVTTWGRASGVGARAQRCATTTTMVVRLAQENGLMWIVTPTASWVNGHLDDGLGLTGRRRSEPHPAEAVPTLWVAWRFLRRHTALPRPPFTTAFGGAAVAFRPFFGRSEFILTPVVATPGRPSINLMERFSYDDPGERTGFEVPSRLIRSDQTLKSDSQYPCSGDLRQGPLAGLRRTWLPGATEASPPSPPTRYGASR